MQQEKKVTPVTEVNISKKKKKREQTLIVCPLT